MLGLGMGGIQDNSDAEIEAIIRKAMAHGVNYFDLCCGASNVFAPFGKAISGRRDQVYLQMHLGAVYNAKGEYAWTRSLEAMKKTFAWELATLSTDYADMGFLHCVDDDEDYEALVSSGALEYLQALKANGTVRHIGFSSHTPSVAQMILDTGLCDMMMFSINPAYDFGRDEDSGADVTDARFSLFRRCEAEGVGICVMKPFHAGKLLDGKASPFHTALTINQCLQYALDRPGVLTVVPGVRSMKDLDALLGYIDASGAEKDYSVLGGFTAETALGSCVYCNHCQPCPAGIDVGLVNKYYDLAQAGDRLAVGHYEKLSVKASACVHCGHCDSRCPFKVNQSGRMKTIAAYFERK